MKRENKEKTTDKGNTRDYSKGQKTGVKKEDDKRFPGKGVKKEDDKKFPGKGVKKEDDKRFPGKGDKKDDRRFEKKEDKRFDKRDDKRFDKREEHVEEYESDGLNLVGRNAVLEAINNDKTIDKILIKKDGLEGTLKVIVAKAIEKGIIVQEVDKARLDMISETGKHQGIVALCPAHEYVEVDEILAKAAEMNQEPFIIILEGITDPHNLGAIIRTAETCGAHGVIIPKRRAVGLTGVVSKTSAGALEHVMVSRVSNITKTIEDLKKKGVWIACGAFKGDYLFNAPLTGPIALVVGGEGEGVSRLVMETCDFYVKIPMYGKIESLNASVAAGVLMYEVVRRRNFS